MKDPIDELAEMRARRAIAETGPSVTAAEASRFATLAESIAARANTENPCSALAVCAVVTAIEQSLIDGAPDEESEASLYRAHDSIRGVIPPDVDIVAMWVRDRIDAKGHAAWVRLLDAAIAVCVPRVTIECLQATFFALSAEEVESVLRARSDPGP